MAKRYMGEGDPVLDALYEELDATGKKTRADRRKRRQLERQIRKIRAGRLGGIKGRWEQGFPRLRKGIETLGEGLMYQHISKPQLDQFADEIQANIEAEAAGEERPFDTPAQDVLGFKGLFGGSFQPRAEVPPTVAVPELEEIEVTAERIPAMIEAEPKFDIRSKLGSNQISSIKKRRRTMERHPDAYRPDYAIKFLPDWMKDEYRDELLDFASTFSPYESQRAPLAFTPHGRRTTPAGQYAKGKKVKKSKKSKAIGEEGWLFDPSDPVDVGLMGLSAIPIGGRAAAGAGLAGKAGIKALMKAMQRSKHRLPRISPQFTGADDWLTLSEQLARAKGRSALTALRPTAESVGTAAEREMMREVLTPLSVITGGGALNAALAPVKRRREEERNLEEFIAGNEAEELREEQMAEDRELAEMLALSGVDVDGMSPEIQALIEAEQAGGYAHGGTLTGQADRLSRAGRGDDTMLMHVTPEEVQGIASLAPGMMTINPETGLPEAGWFRNMLGFAAPFLAAMIPGIGPLAAGALGGAGGSLIRGGDLKDALLGGITGLAGGALMKGLSGAGAQTAGLEDIMGGADVSALENIVNPEQFTELGSLVGPDAMNVGDALSSMNISESGIMESLADMPYKAGGIDIPAKIYQRAGPDMFPAEAPWNKPFEQMSFGERMAGIKGGGLGGLTDQLMTLPGLGTIAGTGLQATKQSRREFVQNLEKMEEAQKRREDAFYQMYPENIPYAGGGSIYKNRYINGNWS